MTMMMIVHKHMYSQRGELQLCILKSISVYDCLNVVVCGEFLPLPLLQRYSKTRGAQGRQRIEFGESGQERAVLSLKCKQMKQHDDCSKETFSPIIVKWKVDELVSTDKLATGERDFDFIFSIHRWSINVFQTREV